MGFAFYLWHLLAGAMPLFVPTCLAQRRDQLSANRSMVAADLDHDGQISQEEFLAWGSQQYGPLGVSSSGVHTTCPVLMRLPGGCAHDMAIDDPAVPSNTLVSHVCPQECSGHDTCAHAVRALSDVSFLGDMVDSVGDGNGVTAHGDACVDGGGVKFAGDGQVRVLLPSGYQQSGTFTISLWLLVGSAPVWAPDLPSGDLVEVLFSQPSISTVYGVNTGVKLMLCRDAWMVKWSLVIGVSGVAIGSFSLDLMHDETPRWSHVCVTIDGALVTVLLDGTLIPMVSHEHSPPAVRHEVHLERWVGFHSIDSLRSDRAFHVRPPRVKVSSSFAEHSSDNTERNSVARLTAIFSASEMGTYTFTLMANNGADISVEPLAELFVDGQKVAEVIRDCDASERRCYQTAWSVQSDANRSYFLEMYCRRNTFTSDCSTSVTLPSGNTLDPVPASIVGNQNLLSVATSYLDKVKQAFQAQMMTRKVLRGQLRPWFVLGSESSGTHGFHGSIAMVRVYPFALDASGWMCVLESGKELIHSGRLGQRSSSSCRPNTFTGCTSEVADNFQPPPHGAAIVDDHSCHFRTNASDASAVEHGLVRAHASWQRVTLRSIYRRPVVFIAVVPGASSTPLTPRIRALRHDAQNGEWQFEVLVEQHRCHLSSINDISVDLQYLVVEGGIHSGGLQAGIRRVADDQYHRVSLLAPRSTPIIISQVQSANLFNHTKFVSTRQHLAVHQQAPAFFVKLQGEGIWCADGQFEAAYFTNPNLDGSAAATQCEPAAPDYSWADVPDALQYLLSEFNSYLDNFSARWQARLHITDAAMLYPFVFTSEASSGSRLSVDGVVVVDLWDEHHMFVGTSGALRLSSRFPSVVYEFHASSLHSSYAHLSWTTTSRDFNLINDLAVASSADSFYEDIGWMACDMNSEHRRTSELTYLAGHSVLDRVGTISYSEPFHHPPILLTSVSTQQGHTDAVVAQVHSADLSNATVALADNACAQAYDRTEEVSWVAWSTGEDYHMPTQIGRTTHENDTRALLELASSIGLPEYFHWAYGTDPCLEGWYGIECHMDISSGLFRVVVLDIHSLDLAGAAFPWSAIAQLTQVEEISVWGCGLTGIINGEKLCALRRLQHLTLSANQLVGSLPPCLATLPIHTLLLNDNKLSGPLGVASPLGRFLLNSVAVLNLGHNRWAPLLPSDKRALQDIGAALTWPDRDWDFEGKWTIDTNVLPDLLPTPHTAQTSLYRVWPLGSTHSGVWLTPPFDFPYTGEKSDIWVGGNGEISVSAVPEQWTYTGYDLRLLSGGSDMWSEAREFCRAHYHDLAAVHTAEQNLLVTTACQNALNGKGVHSCFIGFHLGESAPTWSWSDSSAVDFTNWHSEPTETASTSALIIGGGVGAGGWTTHNASSYLPGFVCQGSGQMPVASMGGICDSGAQVLTQSTGLLQTTDSRMAATVDCVQGWCIPKSPSGYASSVSCAKRIRARPGEVVELAFMKFNLEPTRDCPTGTFRGRGGGCYLGAALGIPGPPWTPTQPCSDLLDSEAIMSWLTADFLRAQEMTDIAHRCGDSLQVYDGPDAQAPLIGIHVGRYETLSVRSTGRDMFVVLVTDEDNLQFRSFDDVHDPSPGERETPGFQAVWKFVQPDPDPEEHHRAIRLSTTSFCVDTEGTACQFPFEYNGETYNECITEPRGLDENIHRRHWCTTVGGGWGYCACSARINAAVLERRKLVDVRVDGSQILLGGSGLYAGSSHDTLDVVEGPTAGIQNALQLSDEGWLALKGPGQAVGLSMPGSWTVDVWTKVGVATVDAEAVLVSSGSGTALVAVRTVDHRLQVGRYDETGVWRGAAIEGFNDGEWHRLTVRVDRVVQWAGEYAGCFVGTTDRSEVLNFNGGVVGLSACAAHCRGFKYAAMQWSAQCACSDIIAGMVGESHICGDQGQHCGMGHMRCGYVYSYFRVKSYQAITQTYFLDGQEFGSSQFPMIACEDQQLCDEAVSTIGNHPKVGSTPTGWPFPIHAFSLYDGAMAPTILDTLYSVQNSRPDWDPFDGVSYRASNTELAVQWSSRTQTAGAIDVAAVRLSDSSVSLLRLDQSTSVDVLWQNLVAACNRVAASELLKANASDTTHRMRFAHSDPCFDDWTGVRCSDADWPVGSRNLDMSRDCESLEWDANTFGLQNTCGSSLVGAETEHRCVAQPYEDAMSLCSSLGARLCTAQELASNEGNPSLCGYQSMLRWSWSSDSDCATGARGVAGGSGQWYALDTAFNHMHEVHVTSQGPGESRSLFQGIYDADTNLVHAVVYSSHGRTTMRFNASNANTQYFALVARLPEVGIGSSFAIQSSVVPSEYVWYWDTPTVVSATERLQVNVGESVEVRLPFPFTWFGIQYEHVSVTACGYIRFDQGDDTDLFRAGGAISVAWPIDMSRPGSTVVMATSAESVTVSWHAPLFSSSLFSDTAITLHVNGSVVLQWDRVVLNDAATLTYQLCCSYSFDKVGDPYADDYNTSTSAYAIPIVEETAGIPLNRQVGVSDDGCMDNTAIFGGTSLNCAGIVAYLGFPGFGFWVHGHSDNVCDVAADVIPTVASSAWGVSVNMSSVQDVASKRVADVCPVVCAVCPVTYETDTDRHLMLKENAHLKLPPRVLGGSMSVSVWIKLGWLFQAALDGSFTVFNSFQRPAADIMECTDKNACRNAIDNDLGEFGWVAFGNVGNGDLRLWSPNTVYPNSLADGFWAPGNDEWMMFTATAVQGSRQVSIYIADELQGHGVRTAPIPRVFRSSIYVGVTPDYPYMKRHLGSLEIDDIRIYDRPLAPVEVAHLFSRADTPCCVISILQGMDEMSSKRLDMSETAMQIINGTSTTTAVRVVQSGLADVHAQASDHAAQTDAVVDICSSTGTVASCHGVLRDGDGPYSPHADCSMNLKGTPGTLYSLSFTELNTEAGLDWVTVFDGDSSGSPLLGRFTGRTIPPHMQSSGSDLFITFTSSNSVQYSGFSATFECIGSPFASWSPADVAEPLASGAPSIQVDLPHHPSVCIDQHTELAVQCCADTHVEQSHARVVELDLADRGIRGTIADSLGHLGALSSLRLQNNFISGTLPVALKELKLLRDLQLKQNQLELSTRSSLTTLLTHLPDLSTLSLAMSSAHEDLSRSVYVPGPPLNCRVGQPCDFQIQMRTLEGIPFPHGGRRVRVTRLESEPEATFECLDGLDGTYDCSFPSEWLVHRGEFEFHVSSDGEGVNPARTTRDPSTGAESTAARYQTLAVIIEPISCSMFAHSMPSQDGSHCVCSAGFYKRTYGTVWTCDLCNAGQMPASEATRCDLCTFGLYSRDGRACIKCPDGFHPNLDSGATECERCSESSISLGGSKCEQCPADQIADSSRTKCVCPNDHYNSSVFDRFAVQCIGLDDQATEGLKTQSVCSPCSGLECVRCSPDGVQVVSGWSASRVAQESRTPWLVFHCPDAIACLAGGGCKDGHESTLCNVCSAGFGMANHACTACSETNLAFIVVTSMAAVVAALVVLRRRWKRRGHARMMNHVDYISDHLTDNPLRSELTERTDAHDDSASAAMFLRTVFQPTRILVGYVQVVNQIGIVLAVDLPPAIARVFSYLGPLAAMVKSIVTLDCLGDFTFYTQWSLRVFLIPLALIAMASAKYLVDRRHSQRAGIAKSTYLANLYFIVFLLYPGICNDAFSMFNCRPLGAGFQVLRVDYRVHCLTAEHSAYEVVAFIVILVVAVGFPLAMVILMLRRMHEYTSSDDVDRFVARRVADELKLDDRVAEDVIRDVKTGREYSFLVNAFKPRFYYWEGCDMVRKLVLVGMLVLAGRGSVAQLFLAVCVSCTSLVLQVHLQPYKHPEDNAFKTSSEIHIFLVSAPENVVTIALVLKCLGTQTAGMEPFGYAAYDILLVASFVVAIPAAYIWTLYTKRGMMQELIKDMGHEEERSTVAKQRAVRMLQLGLSTNDDMRSLSVYFNQLENMVNQWSHVFISYRVASDRVLARRLYDTLSALTLDETGQKMRIYLDQTRLEDGQRWDSGFMQGLAKSWVFVPIVSVGSVGPMAKLETLNDWCDNVLLEWTAALELHQRGNIKAVLPVFASGKDDFFGEAHETFGGVTALPSHASVDTMTQVVTHLQDTTGDGSIGGLRELLQQVSGQAEPTIQATVGALLKFQGIKVAACGTGITHGHGHLSADSDDLTDCTQRVHAAVSSCLKKVGLEQGGAEKKSPQREVVKLQFGDAVGGGMYLASD